MIKKVIYFFCITAVFSSCVSTKLPSKQILELSNLQDDEGMIVGSLAFDTSEFSIKNSYDYYFKKDGDTIFNRKDALNDKVTLIPPQDFSLRHQPDLQDGSKAVYYFAVKKSTGDYRFYLMLFKQTVGTGMGLADLMTELKLDIPFKIEKGKVNYIGEIFFIEKKIKIEEKKFRFEHTYEIIDNRARDIPKLNQLFPNLHISDATQQMKN